MIAHPPAACGVENQRDHAHYDDKSYRTAGITAMIPTARRIRERLTASVSGSVIVGLWPLLASGTRSKYHPTVNPCGCLALRPMRTLRMSRRAVPNPHHRAGCIQGRTAAT